MRRSLPELLTHLYWSAVDAVAPAPALVAALEGVEPSRSRRVWILAIGKAAHPMAAAAVHWLGERGVTPAGGVIVAPSAARRPHPALVVATGDHPIPGSGSFAAATKVGEMVACVKPADEVWVLLSGGATSLMAAPDGTIEPDELIALFRLLLDAGLDIGRANAVRKRFLRWGGGRLALALHPARIRNFILSDVVGDDPATIGSGPCVADVWDAAGVRGLLEEERLWNHLPPSLRRHLTANARSETPKAGDPAFDDVEWRIIANNRMALDAAASRATERGFDARIITTTLKGPARDAGQRAGNALLASLAREPTDIARTRPVCLLWGGETTVATSERAGAGGRCQELALASARELRRAEGDGSVVTVLAAGTDGRDGATDAAGAIVDTATWSAIERTGIDPTRALEWHDAYPALDAAGALLRTGLTETNVMDVVIGVASAERHSSVM